MSPRLRLSRKTGATVKAGESDDECDYITVTSLNRQVNRALSITDGK